MCAVSRAPENASRTSVAFGVASLAILLTGFVTGSWVTTREPYRAPGTGATTAAAFRIGLWKVCPALRKINSTLTDFRSLSCKYIRYTSDWDLDLAKEDFGIDSEVYFTQSFVAKMRWCTPLVGISLCLMLAGCVFSFSGHFYKDQKTLIASSLYTLAGLVLAAGLFVFASMLNDSFSPVVYRPVDGDGDAYRTTDGGERRYDNDDDGTADDYDDYDYRYGWSFIACSLAFLASEASAVFTITAYFQRLEHRVRYTAVDRKPSPPDTPTSLSAGGVDDRSSGCSADGPATDSAQDAGRQPVVQCGGGGGGVECYSDGTSTVPQTPVPPPPQPQSLSSSAAAATGSKTPPDICPPKITSCDDSVAVVRKQQPPQQQTYCSATLNHKQHYHHQQQQQQQHHHHHRQTLAVQAGHGPQSYEVDTSKPCTCSGAAAAAAAAAATTTRRYATIAGMAVHNGGKLQYTTTTALATAGHHHHHHHHHGNGKRSAAAAAAVGLASIKESAAAAAAAAVAAAVAADHHHRKPDPPPTRRLMGSVGGYVVPQTPIAALEALDCPPVTAADPRLVMPSSV